MPTHSASPPLPGNRLGATTTGRINRDGRFAGRHVVSIAPFTPEDLAYVFDVAHEMRTMVELVGTFDLLKGKVLANLFYAPSTRTASSFMAAMYRLGGAVIPIQEVQYSSVSKGETLADTVRTLETYADVLVLRHHETGSAALAARHASKPIINAGDGVGEHPTQALLDLFTILEERGSIHGLTITLQGDLLYGRTVHSLVRLLTLFDVDVKLVGPEALRFPAPLLAEVRARGLRVTEHRDLEEVLGATDVLYVTRVQKEHFTDAALYEQVQGSYRITPDVMARAREKMVLMHPFPRVGEIAMEVDADPRAAYFRQMKYGLYVRMALLAMVLGRA